MLVLKNQKPTMEVTSTAASIETAIFLTGATIVTRDTMTMVGQNGAVSSQILSS